MDLFPVVEEVPLWPGQVLFLNSSLETVYFPDIRNGLCPTLILVPGEEAGSAGLLMGTRGTWVSQPLASSSRLWMDAGTQPRFVSVQAESFLCCPCGLLRVPHVLNVFTPPPLEPTLSNACTWRVTAHRRSLPLPSLLPWSGTAPSLNLGSVTSSCL